MKRVATVAILALATLSNFTAARAADETKAMAQTMADDAVKAFNAQDAQGFAARYATDVDGVTLALNATTRKFEFAHVEGRKQVQDAIAVCFQVYPKAKLKKKVEFARLITPDVLVVDETFELSGFPPEAGPSTGATTIIYKKSGNRWDVVCERLIAYGK